MSLTDEDKDWFRLTVENATLKAQDAHVEKHHVPLENKIARLARSARNEARLLVGGAATAIAAWEWAKAHFGSK